MYHLLIIPMKMILLQEDPYPISEETEFLMEDDGDDMAEESSGNSGLH